MLSKVQSVAAMESAAFAGDWDKFRSFLADDVYFRVGNTAELRGSKAVAEWMINMLTTRLALYDLQVRDSWETPDAAISEFSMKATRMKDNKDVSFPCLDIYRFHNGKINDWRVFAIEPTHIQ